MQALVTSEPPLFGSQGAQEALGLSWFLEPPPNLRTMFPQFSLTQEDGQNSLVGYILERKSISQRNKASFSIRDFLPSIMVSGNLEESCLCNCLSLGLYRSRSQGKNMNAINLSISWVHNIRQGSEGVSKGKQQK